MTEVPFFPSPEGHELPFLSDKPHRVGGKLVPQRMLYPSRQMLAEAIAALPPGATADLASIRADLARRHGAETTCPVTSQHMLQEVAAQAYEAWTRGQGTGTPFWRIVDPDRPSARRLPGGVDFIRARRQAERKGKNEMPQSRKQEKRDA